MYFFLLNDVFVTQLSSLSGGIYYLQFSLYYLTELDIASLQGIADHTDMQRKKFRHPTFGINVPRSKNRIFYYSLEDEVESVKHYLEPLQEDIKKIKSQ
jgi:hypothetical protein